MKMMNDKGSLDSVSNVSKWSTMASINSSQKGGFASKEPLLMHRSKIGLHNKSFDELTLVKYFIEIGMQ
jgi:hypothetical protein